MRTKLHDSRHSDWPRWLTCRLPRLLFAMFAVATLSAPASAQEYRADKVDPQARRNGSIVLGAVRSPARYAADKAKVEEYLEKYYFPEMTQTGPDQLAGLGDARYNFFRKYLWATENQQMQQDLTAMAYKAARDIISANNPPYHPAVRYNAVLLLGQLDQQYATGANGNPPVPLPAATDLLTKIVEAAAADKPVPPPVTLGALIGLERHAQFRQGLAPEAATAMTAALLKLVQHEKPIQDMDRDTYAWLRLRAASVLAHLGAVGPKNEVHDALVNLIGEFRSLDDRTATAGLLGKLKYEGAKLEGDTSLEQLFRLARDVGAAEAKRAEDFQNAKLGGSFGARMGGEMPMSFGVDGQRETFPRRHVLARLMDLRIGLRAVKPAVSEDMQVKIDAVLKAIQPAITAAADQDMGELNLAGEIHKMASAVERAVPPPNEAPAEEPAVEKPPAESPAADEPAAGKT